MHNLQTDTDFYQTISGKKIFPYSPDADVVDIEDIAHALSYICRFGGHTKKFYSVAQHSVLVSYVVKQENALFGLMHDASEAYLGDVVRPLKDVLTDYQLLELRWQDAILTKYKISGDASEIREADNHVLAFEIESLINKKGQKWPDFKSLKMDTVKITPWPSYIAESLFFQRYIELMDGGDPKRKQDLKLDKISVK